MLICSSVCLLEDNTDKAFSSNSENAGKSVLVRWCLCSICITLVVKHNKWLCNRENVYSSSFVPHWELPVPAGTAGSVDCYLLYLIICFCECQELENRNNNMFRDLILSHDPQGLFPPLIPKGQLQVVEVEKVMRKDSCEGLIWTCWSVLKTMIISTSHPPCPTVIVPTLSRLTCGCLWRHAFDILLCNVHKTSHVRREDLGFSPFLHSSLLLWALSSALYFKEAVYKTVSYSIKARPIVAPNKVLPE